MKFFANFFLGEICPKEAIDFLGPDEELVSQCGLFKFLKCGLDESSENTFGVPFTSNILFGCLMDSLVEL